MRVRINFLGGILIMLYLMYFVVISINNDFLGDILSPVLVFIPFLMVFYGYYLKEKILFLKLAGIFISIGMLAWAILDGMWGYYTIILNSDPEENFLILYGYGLTNLGIFIAFMFFAYSIFRRQNKMQLLLDVIIVSFSAFIIIWVFVFNRDGDKAALIKEDTVSMLCIIADVLIYAIVNIWFFSTRYTKLAYYIHLAVVGGLLFSVSDLIYYYQYFYTEYVPNSILDGIYMVGFLVLGISGIVKVYDYTPKKILFQNKKAIQSFKKDLILILVPASIFLFKPQEMYYVVMSFFAISMYYVFSNYIQNNIFKDKILEKEKEYVIELEQKVEDRTREIIRIMNTDVITGLYSRRFFEEHLTRACENIEKKDKIILLYADLNKYKAVRSVYGKFTAESLLKHVGARIKSIIDEENGIVASYGTDVFVILLEGNISYEYGIEVANKIIYNCSDSYRIEGHDIRVTFNIGVSSYPIDAKTTEDLIKNGDHAMFEARKKGFNKVCQYNESIGNEAYKRTKIEMRLKKVDFNEEFRLNYQPQVIAETGELYGFEALIRWYTKSGKFISPLDFIPITEETGLIVPLGYWIIEEAAKTISTWNNIYKKSLKMAVNVSVKQLIEKDFVEKLQDILNSYKINFSDFEIEITENVQIEDNREIIEKLQAIRNIGIAIAIDDFGTGYSSLYYLKNLPVDRIKIAKEMIDNIESDIYSHSIAQMVINIAKTKDIRVIAEGVETKEQWEILKNLECDEIQGYYFSRPLTEDDVEEMWLKK